MTTVVFGVAEFRAKLINMIDEEKDKVIIPALWKGGKRLETLMRRRAPKGLTGNLRQSIYASKGRKDMRAIDRNVAVGLFTRYYYTTLDVGRKGGFKRKGTPKRKAVAGVRGTLKFKSAGTGIREAASAYNEEVSTVIKDEIRKRLNAIWNGQGASLEKL